MIELLSILRDSEGIIIKEDDDSDDDIKNKHLRNKLLNAVLKNKPHIIKEVASDGLDVNAPVWQRHKPIALACKLGNLNSVECLLEHGADITVKTPPFRTSLLHIAAQRSNIELINLLIRKGIDVNVPNILQQTALHFAVLKDQYDIAKQLIDNGARVNVISMGYKEFENMDTEVTPLIVAAQNDNLPIVQLLLNAHADLNPNVKHSISPLLLACYNGNMDMIKLFIDSKADINAKNYENISPLHCAVQRKYAHVVEFLLSLEGIEYDAETLAKHTPLHVACNNGSLEIVRMLLKKGARINLEEDIGLTPLHCAIRSARLSVALELIKNGADVTIASCQQWTVLHTAVHKDLPRLFIELLIDKGCDINAKVCDGRTALHIAVEDKLHRLIPVLINKSANIEIKDNKNWTPLHYAVYDGNFLMTQILIENNARVSPKTTEGNTPLHFAAGHNHANILEYLLDKNAQINACDIHGWTPLHLSAKEGREDIAVILLQRGANVHIREVEYGMTPFHLLIIYRHFKLINIFIEYGADVNCAYKFMITPLHLASSVADIQTIQTLMTKGANFDAKLSSPSAKTPIMYAAQNSDSSVAHYYKLCEDLFQAIKSQNCKNVKKCLDRGAYVNCNSVRYKTPLILACWKGYLNIVNILLRNGADVSLSLEGNVTPLHYAVKSNNLYVVYSLLKHGATFDASSVDLKTPLNFAQVSGNSEIAQLFQVIECLFKNVAEHKIRGVKKDLARLKYKNIDQYLAILGARNKNGDTLSEYVK